MSIITTSVEYKSLKATLDNILTDPVENPKEGLLFPKWMEVKSMSDNWEEDSELAGTLLFQEKAEGATATVGTIQEGGSKRYTSRTMALHLHVAEEALEDSKYDKYINAAKRLTKSGYKTQDLDATNVLIRSTNSLYTGGVDTVILGSASHTTPYGGTWSNIADLYQTPSMAAVVGAITKVGKYPSQNGQIEGATIKKIVCPLAQWAVWETILGSMNAPGGNLNDKNVLKGKGIEVLPIKYLDGSTTTLWGAITDADNGLQWRNRRKMTSRTWVDNDAMVMKYGVSYREAHGWSDPRCWYQGNT